VADVLSAFAEQRLGVAERMAGGEAVGIGPPGDARRFAPILRSRAEALLEPAEGLRGEADASGG
jgi:hypothetical protein